MKRMIQSVVLITVLLCFSTAFGQYYEEAESFVEGYIGGNLTMPTGYLANDLDPDSLNATMSVGFEGGAGYFVKDNLIVGLYFSLNNMGTEDLDLNHRIYELGAYGKYLFRDLTEVSFSPYARATAGLNFSKLVTKVESDGQPLFRELSLDPTFGFGLALGIHYKTNDFGGLFLEAGYNYDFTNDVVGDFKGVDYPWGDNNQYLAIMAGVLFNIGPKE